MPKLEDYGFEKKEKVEVERLQPTAETDYPSPEKRFRLILESYTASIEEAYFWILNHLKLDQGFSNVIKISDVFTAAEISAIGGTIQQRLAAQQEKAAGYLRGIHEMTKQLFQIVREVRILNERLEYYEKSKLADESGKNAEMALKDMWVTLVEGGTKNPASIFGLAQQVGFVALPDVFFRTRKLPGESDKEFAERIAKLEFNEHFKDVLKRKLAQYYIWKDKTYHELSSRRKFVLKLLRQYYDTIRLYMSWLKPYLKTIKRLGGDISKMSSPDLIAAFESSVVDIEILATKQSVKGDYKPVILATFEYSTSPSLNYTADQFQRGPIHVGRLVMTLRSYAWTQNEIDNYIKYREAQDFEILEDIDNTVKEAMEALGDELKNYLIESGEKFREKQKPEAKKEKKPGFVESALDPFVSVFKGFGELFGVKSEKKEKGEKPEKTEFELEKDKDSAKAAIKFSLYQLYKNYKKAHGFLSW